MDLLFERQIVHVAGFRASKDTMFILCNDIRAIKLPRLVSVLD